MCPTTTWPYLVRFASDIIMGAPAHANPNHNYFPFPEALLFSCVQRNSDVDPKLGLECFESHRLPPGTQYEGIEKLDDNVLSIRIMNGVEVMILDCGLNPDGTFQGTGK